MGVVFRARHRKLGRVVALKLSREHLGTGPEAARFYQEAAAVARLDHPNIVPVFEVGEADGRPYFSMALVEGKSLAQEAPLLPRRAAQLMREVALAIGYAHARGVVHRDLKPENILLDPEGRPRVTDFGVAKCAGEEGLLTRDGEPLGTPSFMPPEQAMGLSGQMGPLVDVYSLGATLYCLLTGRPPFRAASALETMKQVVEREPASPRSLNPAVDRDLETICQKCLSKDPRQRYGSAQELADDLGRFLEGRPIQARPLGPLGKAARWCQRSPALAAAALCAAASVLAALALMTWAYFRVSAALDEEASQRQAAVQLENAERWERYLANMALASSALQTGNISAARRSIEAAPAAHLGWEWRHFRQQIDRSLLVFRHDGQVDRVAFVGASSLLTVGARARRWSLAGGEEPLPGWLSGQENPMVAVSADGQRLAHQRGAEVVVLDLGSGEERVLPGRQTAPPHHLAFSLDGQRLYRWHMHQGVEWRLPGSGLPLELSVPAGMSFGYGGELAGGLLTYHDRQQAYLTICDIRDNRPLSRIAGPMKSISAAAFNREGTRLVTSESYPSNLLRLWDPRSGKLLAVMRGHTNQAMCLTFSPDGKRIASSSFDQTTRLWDGDTGALIATLTGHSGRVLASAFSPDSRRLVTGSQDRSIRLWDAADGRPITTLFGHEGEVHTLAYRGDGKLLASASADQTARVWDVEAAERNGILSGHGSFVYGVAWHPDGRRLASAAWDGTIRQWDADSGRQVSSRPVSRYGFSVAYSPKGGLLASLSRDNAIHLWSPEDGRELHRWTAPTDHWLTGQVTFSPNGKLLAASCSDGVVRLWDVESRAAAGAWRGHKGPVHGVAFSPDGRFLASSGSDGDAMVQVWEVKAGALARSLPLGKESVFAVAWSADGKLLASASKDGLVRLWDTERWEPCGELRQGTSVFTVCFHPDGTRLAAGCADGSVRLWDLPRQREVVELLGHKAYVHSAAFSPDGTRLATASGDFTVRLWDTKPPSERAPGR
jgi:WD40 repeat protein